jgi:hypothetical protein
MAGLELGKPEMAIVSAQDIKDVREILKTVYQNLEGIKVQISNMKAEVLAKAKNKAKPAVEKKAKMSVKSKKS